MLYDIRSHRRGDGSEDGDGGIGGQCVLCLQSVGSDPMQCIGLSTVSKCIGADTPGSGMEEVGECPSGAIGVCKTSSSEAFFYPAIGLANVEMICSASFGVFEEL